MTALLQVKLDSVQYPGEGGHLSWEASRHEGPHRQSFEVRYATGALRQASLGPDWSAITLLLQRQAELCVCR